MTTTKDNLPPPEHAFEWPYQMMREQNWSEAARRWAVLCKAYPEHPHIWFQGANAHIKASELEQAEVLLAHARQHFPQNPNTFIFSAELAIHMQEWDVAKAFLLQARKKFPDNMQTWVKSADCAERQGDLEQATAYKFIDFRISVIPVAI